MAAGDIVGISDVTCTINNVDYKVSDWDIKDRVETVDVPYLGAGDYADTKIKVRALADITLTLVGVPTGLSKMTAYVVVLTKGTTETVSKTIKITDIEDKGSASGANTFVLTGYVIPS